MSTFYGKEIATIVMDKDHVLLVRNKNRPEETWKFPQGETNGKYSVEREAQRIIRSEVGSDVKINFLRSTNAISRHSWPENLGKLVGDETLFVVLKYAGGKINHNGKSSHEKRWVLLRDALGLLCNNYKNRVIEALTSAEVIEGKIRDIADLKKIGFKIQEINKTGNSIRGIVIKDNKKYFLKRTDNFILDVVGYILLKDVFPTPGIQIIFPEANVLLYNYYNGLYTQESTLHLQMMGNISSDKVTELFSFYRKSSKVLVQRSYFPANVFFGDRIKSRIKPWYLYKNNSLFKKTIIINGLECTNTFEIITRVVNYFEAPVKKKYTCLLSQGDPTDVNMSLHPLFLDTPTAGYNPIISDLSIFVWCHLLAGNYFYPKYHPHAYLTKIPLKELVFSYKTINNSINIKLNFSLDKNTVGIIRSFLFALPLNKISRELENDFKYFLMMRIFSTLNVTKMSKRDIVLSIALANLFWEKDRKAFKHVISLLNNGGLK